MGRPGHRRRTAGRLAGAYLGPVLDRANLAVETGCLVTGLEIQQGRCTGIRYLRDGQLVRARASGEVIVCAGAVGSARLLLLSGIGPADHLRAARHRRGGRCPGGRRASARPSRRDGLLRLPRPAAAQRL